MSTAVSDSSSATALQPNEPTARALLRFVDRAALVELTAAFVEAVELPVAVLSPGGQLITGAPAECPACDAPLVPLVSSEPRRAESSDSTWLCCEHGLRSLVVPIRARTGELLATATIGALAGEDADLDRLRRALIARGDSGSRAEARLTSVTSSTLARAEAAARLLTQTFDTIVREAAIASEHADLVAIQRQANRELTVLYSVARALGSGIELQAIVQRLVDVVSELLDSDVALVGLIQGSDLVTVASCGLLTFEARNGRLKVGEGLAGRVAATGGPLTSQDMQEDPREYLTAINSREQLHAFAGVPLKLRGAAVGVLALYWREPHVIPESELQVLSHIADQATVAMERAQLYEQDRLTTGELRSLHGQVESQHQALERATAVHEQLTKMVLQDAGLDAIADSLARLLESPVAVEDQFHHLLARGPRDATDDQQTGVQEPPWTPAAALNDPEVRRLFDTVRESRQPVSFPPLPRVGLHHPRIVAPVIVGGDLLGFLSVSERERQLEETDMLALGHAITVVALEMMKQRTRAEVERRLRGELLEELVAGRVHDADAVQRRAAYLGYNLASPHVLLFVSSAEHLETASPTSPRGARASRAAIFQDLVAAHGAGAMVMSRVDGIVIAVPVSDGCMAQARAIAESLKRDADLRGISGITIGLGRICHSPEDFPFSFTEACRALDLARSLGNAAGVVSFEDLGVYRLLLDLPRPTDAVHFAERLLAPLEAYDDRHGTNLIATLEAFLVANGVLQHAANSMAVHVNTLTYRLQRIRELAGIDLNDSDARLEAHLAVKIRQVLKLTFR